MWIRERMASLPLIGRIASRVNRRPDIQPHIISPYQIEASFKNYSYKLLDSFGLFNAYDNALVRTGVDQRFVDRFAAYALHHIDPEASTKIFSLRVPLTFRENEDLSFVEETLAYDYAARAAFELVVNEAKSRGAYNKLLPELRTVRNGGSVWVPEYNRPSLSWEVRKVYSDCRKELTVLE